MDCRMFRGCSGLLFILAAVVFSGMQARGEALLDFVALTEPAVAPAGVVILFPDPTTAEPVSRSAVHALAEAGQVVAAVDTRRYMMAMERGEGPCIRAADELAVLKAALFVRFGLTMSASAVLAGEGRGGAMAYAVLAQSRPGQFTGAVAFRFNPELPGLKPLCPGAPTAKTSTGFRYLPVDRLNGFWRMATSSPDDAELRPYAQGDDRVLFPLRPYDDLASAVIAVIADATRPAASPGQGIADLPLVLLPVERPAGTMAIIYSGDGGWRDLDKQIGEALHTAGIPVVGVDTLRGFWHRQTPESATRDLERILDHFTRQWNSPNVLLIGYSFGADILPFMVNRLKPASLDHLRQISLLGLSRDAAFEIHMSGWLGAASSDDALPLRPELVKLDRHRVQCFVGMDEMADSGCTDPALAGAEIAKVPGGHHFDGDYERLARTIIDGAVRRGGASATPTKTD